MEGFNTDFPALPRGTPRGLIEAIAVSRETASALKLPRGTPRGLIEA